MRFDSPTPFEEALDRLRSQSVMPTASSTAELQALGAEIRERAFFSARVEDARILERASDLVGRLVSPTTDLRASVTVTNVVTAPRWTLYRPAVPSRSEIRAALEP